MDHFLNVPHFNANALRILHNRVLNRARLGETFMHDGLFAAITSEKVVQSKLSVVVTEDCVIIPSFSRQPHTVLSLGAISKIKIVKTYYPSLAVISVGLLLLCAAAFSSKDGAGTGVPIGVLGAIFFVAFIASQRARVVFMNGSEATQTINGSFADVADLVSAVEVTRRNLLEMNSDEVEIAGVFARIRQWVSGILSPRVRTFNL